MTFVHPALDVDTETTLNPRRKLRTTDAIHAGLHRDEREAINELATYLLDEAGSSREVVVGQHDAAVVITSTGFTEVHPDLAIAFTVTSRATWVDVVFPSVINTGGATYLALQYERDSVVLPDEYGATILGEDLLGRLHTAARISTPGDYIIRPVCAVTAGSALLNATEFSPLLIVARDA